MRQVRDKKAGRFVRARRPESEQVLFAEIAQREGAHLVGEEAEVNAFLSDLERARRVFVNASLFDIRPRRPFRERDCRRPLLHLCCALPPSA